MPRAAMSVATSTRVLPSVKAARLRSRAPWLQVAVQLDGRDPGAVSCLASFLAVCLVRMNSRLRSWPDGELAHDVGLVGALTENTWCVIVDTGATAGSTECVTGEDR
jgi:hypothetical protein